ncbi:MAG: T9SS type A sorting domain-containing protein, partial [Bacteroidetes bacterium]|nr:T9SS type A sorting domain-containing protein [Bacteroidota bacterium]
NVQLNKEQTISFTITDKNGQSWTKDIKITIAPPRTYELYQNYPNPFNPTTTIEYQLPAAGTQYIVSLKIYDITGREIAILVNEQQEPGYYQKVFDAGRYASGVYIYRLTAKDGQNKRNIFQKKMLLIK